APVRSRGRGGGSVPPRSGPRPEGRRPSSPERLTIERVVRPAGPYSLALCIRHATDATRHVRDGTLTATVRVGERVELASAHQLVDGDVVLRADGEEGLERLRFVLAVDDDNTEFIRLFARDPMIGEATRRFRGLRILRLSSVAHALVRAFSGQLIDTRHARELEYRIVRATCERVEGTPFCAPPTTQTFAALAPSRLRALGLHARRGAALVRIC